MAQHLRVINAEIAECCQAGALEKAQDLLDQLASPDHYSFSTVVAACAKAGQWKAALKLLKEWRACSSAGKPDVMAHAQVLSACGKAHEWESALDLFGSLQADGAAVDVACYNATMSACGRAGQWEPALRLLDEMLDRGPRPNSRSYAAVITACGKGGECMRALHLLEEMGQRRLPADAICYATAISACGGEHWHRAMGLIDQMEAKIGTPTDTSPYTNAMQVLAAASQLDAGFALLERLDQLHLVGE